jgi:hypothetical protein
MADKPTLQELNADLKRTEGLLKDAQDERSFLGKQANMHINAAEFTRLDRDIERYGDRIESLKTKIAQAGG